MEHRYVYYVPIYPDDDCSEALMHLFEGEPELDQQISNLLHELDRREHEGEGVDYVGQLETQLGLQRITVRHVSRNRRQEASFSSWSNLIIDSKLDYFFVIFEKVMVG